MLVSGSGSGAFSFSQLECLAMSVESKLSESNVEQSFASGSSFEAKRQQHRILSEK